jgi:HSP20 family protein
MEISMAQTVTKLPIKTEEKASAQNVPAFWQPFDSLRREMERVFDEFDGGFRLPFRSAFDMRLPWAQTKFEVSPAIDVAEKDHEYEITAELPGMDEKNIEVKVCDGTLTIKGEKTEEKKEEKKDYHLSERHYGSFYRSFTLPEGINADKIAATFDKGLLKVTFPKPAKPEEKKITVKAA